MDDDIILQLSNYAFDGSVFDIFGSLLNGARLMLIGKEEVTDINKLSNIISVKNVSVFFVTTALFNILMESNPESLLNIRKILFGGEQCSPEHIKKGFERLGDNKIIHMYGPTESTVYTTYFKINQMNRNIFTYPIGAPISNTAIFILDKEFNPVPIGFCGELCISGSGLARGYLNNSVLTNEKFIDNPFMTGEGMYRTGDLARWLPDGNIEFLGRIDSQVKIRGFRIEPGEIENTLIQYEDIDSAVVLAKEGIDGDSKYLVAYYMSETEIEASDLRIFLKRSLPDYMVPSCFVYMDKFPLTSNGKIDRKALPEPDGGIGTGVVYIAPRNEAEEKLVKIWEEILILDKIGIHDNFFDLGGHSLKATRLVSRISKDLGVGISLKDIFSNPTIESIASLISGSDKIEYKHIEEVPDQDSYELSNAQRRLWVLDQLEENSIAYNMPSAFILEGELKTDAFRDAYSFIVERHESLRTVFFTEDGEPRQKILKNPGYKIEIIDIRDGVDPGNKARDLAEKDILTPFDLETGPLVRLTIIEIEDERHLFLFNMHHIVSDGWSMNIFIREFLDSYNSFRGGKSPALKPLRIHYKDYSAWQNDLLESEQISIQKSYWLDKLTGEIPVLGLPSDKVRPALQTFNGNSIGFNLSKETNSALNKLCQENQVSMFMMLHALVKVLFHRYTGQGDIIIGSPVAGRVHEDLEDQIGFYVNTLVLRDTIASDLPFKGILEEVGKTCTDAFDNQTYPFDRLVEDLDLKRDLSRSPLFDVMLVLQNNEDTEIEFDGLELTPFESGNVISKFDMTLNFKESENALFCSIEYNTDIFSEDRITRMIEHLRTLISSVVEDPEARVQDLEIIPKEEKNLLLNVFNDTKTGYPADKTIMDLFEEQARKTPDNIAVVFEDVELTYKELNGKANIVGHYLIDNYDIKPDDLVGILLERSEIMIIAILGILKSGAAYVPIDPGYPQERIDYMLEDSCPKAVLSEGNINPVCNIEFIDIKEVL
ncbi:MAG: AMP-binding protein, partial [Desulfobacteraceae bacterium]|nr:AMP-binding protein [Desulfobacteraceae bacterium]